MTDADAIIKVYRAREAERKWYASSDVGQPFADNIESGTAYTHAAVGLLVAEVTRLRAMLDDVRAPLDAAIYGDLCALAAEHDARVRREALLEAARLCDVRGEKAQRRFEATGSATDGAEWQSATGCAHALRWLAEEKP
jgi:hypothetical protein